MKVLVGTLAVLAIMGTSCGKKKNKRHTVDGNVPTLNNQDLPPAGSPGTPKADENTGRDLAGDKDNSEKPSRNQPDETSDLLTSSGLLGSWLSTVCEKGDSGTPEANRYSKVLYTFKADGKMEAADLFYSNAECSGSASTSNAEERTYKLVKSLGAGVYHLDITDKPVAYLSIKVSEGDLTMALGNVDEGLTPETRVSIDNKISIAMKRQ